MYGRTWLSDASPSYMSGESGQSFGHLQEPDTALFG